jgi:hypothetical protein
METKFSSAISIMPTGYSISARCYILQEGVETELASLRKVGILTIDEALSLLNTFVQNNK